MQIRTQVICFVLFLAILLTSSLLWSQAGGTAQPTTPEIASRPTDPGPFYSAISKNFQVSTDSVRSLVHEGLPLSQVVVVYFVAQSSLRNPEDVLAERRAGQSWRQIAQRSGLQPEQFYYPLPFATRPPFVNVYAVFHQQPRNRWSWDRLPLSDGDIENLVNLRFLAEMTGRHTPEIVQLRTRGLDFVSIHHFLLRNQKTADSAAPGAGAGAAAAAARGVRS